MTDHTVLADSRISRAAFSAELTHRGSPATAEAGSCFDALVAHGVDPAVGLGFFIHESAAGTTGRAAGQHVDPQMGLLPATKSWGNLRWHDVYRSLPYPVTSIDGFVAYATWTEAADHFARHLIGDDGTDNYLGPLGRGMTVSQVVPIFAPRADGNSPTDYIAAVNGFVDEIGGGNVVAKPTVLLVAGHNNIEGITNDGACPGRDFTSLAGSTGAHGEREWTGSFVQLLADALRATGTVDPIVTDAIFHADVYAKHYDLCLINHYHRDADSERAMFAGPDPAMSKLWVSDDAEAQAQRFVDRLAGGYTGATGIPVTEPLVTLNMTQIYTYCYVERETAPVCCEWGNANLDAAVLYEPGIARIVRFARDCILEHLNLAPVTTAPPAQRASDVPPPAPPVTPYTAKTAASELRAIATKLDGLA